MISGDVVFHQTNQAYAHRDKIAKQTTIINGNQPIKIDTVYTYTADGSLLSREETGSLSWKYRHDENSNVINVDFGIGNTTNDYDER